MKRKTENNPQEALKQFLAEKESQGIEERSLKDYRIHNSRLIEGKEFSEITREFMAEKVNGMLKTMKPVSVNHYIRIYRAFLYYCMEMEYLKPFKIKLVREQEAPIKLYTEDELKVLLERPKHTDSFATWRTHAVISFMLSTGARAGTVVCIKKEDLDLKEQTVVYRHEKNKKSSVIPICDSLKKILVSYLNEFEITDYLFPAEKNCMLTTTGLREAFERYCKVKGVQYRSVHAFRHTFAKQFIMNGGNPFQLQRMLDHSSLAMSSHYAHCFATDLKDCINDFSPLGRMTTEEKRINRKK